MSEKSRLRHRLERRNSPSITGRAYCPGETDQSEPTRNAVVDCGWGRLIFSQTFESSRRLAETLRRERPGQRDIALYAQDPHVVVSMAPQEVFLDPSHTYRLWLDRYLPASQPPKGFQVRLLNRMEDAAKVHRLYVRRHMVPPDADFIWRNRTSQVLTIWLRLIR